MDDSSLYAAFLLLFIFSINSFFINFFNSNLYALSKFIYIAINAQIFIPFIIIFAIPAQMQNFTLDNSNYQLPDFTYQLISLFCTSSEQNEMLDQIQQVDQDLTSKELSIEQLFDLDTPPPIKDQLSLEYQFPRQPLQDTATLTPYQSSCPQQSQNNSSTKTLSRKTSSRCHLNRERRKRGEKTKLQQTSTGYWTKNFLPIGKNAHFYYIQSKFGKGYIQNHPRLRDILKKSGIVMEDYLELYRMEEVSEIWKEFFAKKILYRDLMLSRSLPKNKKIFVRFLNRFEQAFITGEFDHIA